MDSGLLLVRTIEVSPHISILFLAMTTLPSLQNHIEKLLFNAESTSISHFRSE
jgi:hypothetical protein